MCGRRWPDMFPRGRGPPDFSLHTAAALFAAHQNNCFVIFIIAKRGAMIEHTSPRFKSAVAALRFYFRAEEVLSAKASLQLFPEGRIRATGENPREDLIFDYLTVASCLKDLNELQRWLLRELYRPGRFGEPPPTVTSACEDGRRLFPRVRWTIQGVGRLRSHTLGTLESRLAHKGLIPPLQAAVSPADKTASAVRTIQGGSYGFSRFEKSPKQSAIALEPRTADHANSDFRPKAPRRREVLIDRSGSRRRALPHG